MAVEKNNEEITIEDKIEETINNSVKAQTNWRNLSVKERVELLTKFVEDFLGNKSQKKFIKCFKL